MKLKTRLQIVVVESNSETNSDATKWHSSPVVTQMCRVYRDLSVLLVKVEFAMYVT